MRRLRLFFICAATVGALACSGSDAVLIGNSVSAVSAAINPQVPRGLDGINGWKRTGDVERYNKEALYGYIDGGAEIVLQYGFRELAVSRYRPAAGTETTKEIVLEIYRMASGEAAFGFYSIKLEGGEKGWPGIKADNWVGQGQASFVKGDYLVNVLAPECDEKEIGGFTAQVERRVPGRGTSRPEELSWLPHDGMVLSSWHFIQGPLAAQNESPFLDGDFWGFTAGAAGRTATTAFSAKYGSAPIISKLMVVKLGEGVDGAAVDAGVLALFNEYLKGGRQEGGLIQGQNEAGRWFFYKRTGAIAGLALGEPEATAALTRLNAALALAAGRKEPNDVR